MTAITIRGEQLILRPDGSLVWPARSTLIVADLHFGKADAFRAAGIPVPGGPSGTLARLDLALDQSEVKRLLVLGDFWHARAGRTDAILEELTRWRSARPSLRIELVRGNHDRAGPPPCSWSEVWHANLVEPPFHFTHAPEPAVGAYFVAGHLHPGIVLGHRSKDRLKLPCFWFGSEGAVLPAFGDFTGTAAIARQPGDRIFALAGEEIVDVSF